MAIIKFLVRAFYSIIVALIPAYVAGQNCSYISGVKNKQTGIETVGGIISSVDYYSLLVQKTMDKNDTASMSRYVISLNAASRVLLSDSILNTKGTFEFLLLDKSVMEVKDVTYINNPLGSCCSLGFRALLSESEMKQLAANPIVEFKVKEILATKFQPKKQKEQQAIFNCLLARQPR